MKRTFFLILLFFCALFVKADVLGPYTMDSNVPPTPTGYARVVLPIGGADASVAVSITVCDESGQQYVLRTTTPNAAPYCYFLAYGVYRVVASHPDHHPVGPHSAARHQQGHPGQRCGHQPH